MFAPGRLGIPSQFSACTHTYIDPLFATNRVYHVMSSKWNLDLCSLKIDIASTEMLCVQEGVFSLSYIIQHNSRQQASSDIDRLDIMRSSSGVVCDKKQSKEFHCYSKHGILLFSDFFSLSFHSSPSSSAASELSSLNH